MTEILRVRYDNNAGALAEALQQALNIVVTDDNIQHILTDRYTTQMNQLVHPRAEGSALGDVTLITTVGKPSKRHDFAIVVSLGYGGQYHAKLEAVRQFAIRACVRLQVAASLMRVSFIEQNHQVMAEVNIPSRLSQVVSPPAIEFE